MISLVPTCRIYPGRCSVMPQLGGNHASGYFDSGVTTVSGERVYVSVYAVGAMAEAIGYKRAGDESGVKAENDRLTARVAELEARIVEMDAELEAVHVLKRGGFASSRKPGRPAKAAA